MPDFFISYTHADVTWAEWIAWTLEAEGFEVTLQKWDFAAGSNFVLEMQKATAETVRTIAVLSPNYLSSAFAGSEWATAFARDPSGVARTLVPVRVQQCNPSGLLGSVVHIDLVGLDEASARAELLDRLKLGRAKPATKPEFPGRDGAAKPFPGPQSRPAVSVVPVTRIRREPTELERRKFLRASFATIVDRFQNQLEVVKQDNAGVEVDFEKATNYEFRAEIFVDGNSKANCKVWIGGMLGDSGISYAEGSTAKMGNAVNETISISGEDGLSLTALMNMGIGKIPSQIDPNRMSADEAAEYLWARFMWRLS